MNNWKTSLGGALSSLGKALIGVGVIPQLSNAPSNLLTGIAIAGFVLDALGGFFAHWAAADKQSVGRIVDAKITEYDTKT